MLVIFKLANLEKKDSQKRHEVGCKKKKKARFNAWKNQ